MTQGTSTFRSTNRIHKTQIMRGMTLIPYPQLSRGEPWQPPTLRPRKVVTEVHHEGTRVIFVDAQGTQHHADDFYLIEA